MFSKIWNVTLDTILGSNSSSIEVVTKFLICTVQSIIGTARNRRKFY